jgi:hypothetical protein
MKVEVVNISKDDLAAMVRGIFADELSAIRAVILHRPDETLISDDEAAKLKGVSIATLRRMKADGRVNSVQTPRGRMCRRCDVE